MTQMKVNTSAISRAALKESTRIRKYIKPKRWKPICVTDLALQLGLNVWFVDGNSFEGMFEKSTNSMFVSSKRPYGRRNFSIAHELGHWRFGHGTKVDSYLESENSESNSPEEKAADYFANHLLMPQRGLVEAFQSRSIDIKKASPAQCYKVACQFNVGYTTIIYQMSRHYDLLDYRHSENLLKVKPATIKSELLGHSFSDHLCYIDPMWECVPIDLEIGDKIVSDANCVIDGSHLEQDGERTFTASSSGICRLVSENCNWAAYVRVSRKGFTGLAEYRYLEEVEDV